MVISALDNSSVHRITSGQVAVDLATCVKELVENSVDARARTVEVRFKNHGLDGIEVVDNGDGIADEDLNSVALKHHTSKIRQFDDLETVATFGFRGEAMSSLCALCDVMMITCCANAVPKATQLSFGHDGNIVSKTMVSGVKGTSVRLDNIFKTLPVRRKELEKTHKREFAKAVEWIQAYAIALENVKLTVTHVLPSKRKSVLFSTSGGSMKQNIATVYGASVLDTLLEMDVKVEWTSRSIIGRLESLAKKDKEGDEYEDREMRLRGYISKPIFGMGRNSKDRQLLFVNSRPCVLPQLSKAINELYKMYNTVQYPIVIADLQMDPRCYDVNVTPDKRTILLNSEETVIEKIKEQLSDFFERAGHSVPSNETVNGLSSQKPATQQAKLSFLENFRSDVSPKSEKPLKDTIQIVEEEGEEEEEEQQQQQQQNQVQVQEEEEEAEEEVLGQAQEEESETPPSPPPKKLSDEIRQARIQHIRQPRYFAPSSSDTNEDDDEETKEPSKHERYAKRRKVEKKTELYNNVRNHKQGFSSSLRQFVSSSQRDSEVPENPPSEPEEQSSMEIDSSIVSEAPATHNDLSITHSDNDSLSIREADPGGLGASPQNTDPLHCEHDHQHPEPPEEAEPEEEQTQQRTFANFVKNAQRQKYHYKTQVNVTLSAIRSGVKRMAVSGSKFTKDNNDLTTGIHKSDIQQEAEEAERLLNLTIRKDDFANMKVIGQFNKGFILVTKKKPNNKPGKDMFIVDQHASDEKFNFERLQRDTMIKKQPLVVPRPLQLSAVDEITLTSNLDIISKNGFGISVNDDGVPGSKCKLASLPLSKSTVFNEKDLDELIYLIQEAPGNESIRCSKVRAMFASRACRSSIMIGQSLTTKTMQRVVTNLASLDKPWNCPHGRPTLRHLTTMDHFVGFIDDVK
jgi:DNA mismatch repair protein PMS2